MTSLERVLTTLSHREPDRVPLFLMLTMHGAKELGLTIREYFSKAEQVVEGQLRLRARYGHDCLCPFFYAALEVEAWGGEVVFREDGPANSGEPLIKKPEQILELVPPGIGDAAGLGKVLRAIEMLKSRVGDEVPIIGVAISPFSLPVMQMGFGPYLELMHERPDLFERLMRVNEVFSANWANAQLDAGATAICYFDPVSSTTIIPRDRFLRTGFQVARRTLQRIHGPTAIHLASGRCVPILEDLIELGPAVIGVGPLEDLGTVKAACRGRVAVLGNLNGVEMCGWSPQQAETVVRETLAKAASGGGFILSDGHGEIPFQVTEDVLMAVAGAARRWGTYPREP
jgi:uroporphyrinogen decarboxylase